jgi:hypothetical protein
MPPGWISNKQASSLQVPVLRSEVGAHIPHLAHHNDLPEALPPTHRNGLPEALLEAPPRTLHNALQHPNKGRLHNALHLNKGCLH